MEWMECSIDSTASPSVDGVCEWLFKKMLTVLLQSLHLHPPSQ